MSKRTPKTKSQTSNLVRKLGNAPSKPVASTKMKEQATGFKMKFNNMNVSNFVTGGSSSTSATANYGNQATVHSIAGKKVGTTTQIPQIATPEPIEAKAGGDSLVSSLAKMFSFMQQTRDDDVKRRETEKSFAEENRSEEQKRHEQFLKVLKDYTSVGTTTLATSGDSGGGIMDYIMNLIESLKKWVEDWVGNLFEEINWIKSLKWMAGLVTAPAMIAFLLAAGLGASVIALWAAENAKLKDLGGEKAKELSGQRQTEELLGAMDDNSFGAAIMHANEETTGDKIRKAIAEKQEVVRALMENEGYDADSYDKNGGYVFRNKEGKAPEAKLLKDVSSQADKLIESGEPIPQVKSVKKLLPYGMKQSTAGGGRGGLGGPTAAEMSTVKSPPIKPSTPTSSPVPPTPATSSVNDLISKNADLTMNESTSSGSGTTQPIIASSSNSTSSPDRAMSSTATQRDDTAILNRVFDRVRGGV